MAPEGEAVPLRGLRDALEVLEPERDVLNVDVHGITEPFPSRGGDELVTRRPDPRPCGHGLRDRVTRQERHGRRLRSLLRQPSREASLAELGLDREPVSGLELQRGGAVRRHLLQDREAELHDLVVRRLREHPGAATDPALAVLVAVGRAGEAGLELVVSPAGERQMGVGIHEAGHDRPPGVVLVDGTVPAVTRPRIRHLSGLPGEYRIGDRRGRRGRRDRQLVEGAGQERGGGDRRQVTSPF
jgi:hypothetical protein